LGIDETKMPVIPSSAYEFPLRIGRVHVSEFRPDHMRSWEMNLNSEVEECENVVLFGNQQPVPSQANFDEVGFIPLKILKPKEIDIIWETSIGIEAETGYSNGQDGPAADMSHGTGRQRPRRNKPYGIRQNS
jgi:hypothetical protein